MAFASPLPATGSPDADQAATATAAATAMARARFRVIPAVAADSAPRRLVGLRDRGLVLAALDAALLALVYAACAWLSHATPTTGVAGSALLMVAANLALNYVSGLYTTLFLNWRTRLAVCLMVNATLTALLLALLSFVAGEPFVVAGKAAWLLPVVAPVALFAGRLAVEGLLRRRLVPRRVLLVGRGREAQHVAQLIADNPLWALHVVGHVARDRAAAANAAAAAGDDPLGVADEPGARPLGPCLGETAALPALAARLRPDVLVIATGRRLPVAEQASVVRALEYCGRLFTAATFVMHFARKVPIDDAAHLDWLGEVGEADNLAYETLKRLVDVAAGLAGVLATLLLLPLVALGTWATTGASPFYRQVRVGQRGRPFVLWKFRTMPADAEANGPQWSPPGDRRVSWFGRLLRRFHIDEVPQFWNILKGEMSLVGPRPERVDFQPLLEQQIPLFRERLLVRPGLTGWAQVNFRYGHSVPDTREKLEYDLYYLRFRTPVLDAAILLRTVAVVLMGRSFPAVPAEFAACGSGSQAELPAMAETLTPRLPVAVPVPAVVARWQPDNERSASVRRPAATPCLAVSRSE